VPRVRIVSERYSPPVSFAEAAPSPGFFASPLALGALAFLLGIGAIAAAIRRRRNRERYPETYAASGGIIYTVVSAGCGVVLMLGGVGLMVLTLVFRR
jgi:uncharacterized membrane protein HdeD (DUF308 family)